MRAASCLVALVACTSEASVGVDARDAGAEAANQAPVADASSEGAVAPPDAGPVDPTGSYSCLLRSGPNGCGITAWQEGKVDGTLNVSIRPADAGAGYRMKVQGLAALNLSLLSGSDELIGTVSGNRLDFRVAGTVTSTVGACNVTYDTRFDGTLVGQKIEGKVFYERVLPADPQCASLACTSEQEVTGYRDTTIAP